VFVGKNPRECGDLVRGEYNCGIVSFRQIRSSSSPTKDAPFSGASAAALNISHSSYLSTSNNKEALIDSNEGDGAVRHSEDAVKPSDYTEHQKLQVGDCVLVETWPAFVGKYQNSNHFAMVREIPGSRPPRRKQPMDKFRLVFAGAVLLGMVVLASLEITNLFEAAVGASFLVIGTKILSVNDAFNSINGRVILAIAAIFGVANALEKTAVAKVIADFIVTLLEPTVIRYMYSLQQIGYSCLSLLFFVEYYRSFDGHFFHHLRPWSCYW
jgi:hypothetical protein